MRIKGYRITINLEEWVEDNFKIIRGHLEACNKEELVELIEKLTTNLIEFIKSNNL